MKRTVKIISAILVCLMLMIPMVSCSKEDIPDGYQLIACEGDCFRLYVPKQWASNSSSGITSAYYSAVENASVSVIVADDAGDMTLSEYWEYCNGKYQTTFKDYKPNEKTEKVILGGQAGEKHVFTASMTVYDETEGKSVTETYKFMQIFAKYKGDMYVFTYSAPEEKYSELLEVVEGNSSDEGIIPYFRFAEPYTSEDSEKKLSDKVTAPDGMKLASTDKRPYRFFVPKSWKINNRTEATAAYASDSDRSNVSVHMYMTGDSADTVEKYWQRLEQSYENMFTSYELISDEKIKMSGIDAHKYTYTAISGGQEYNLIQAIVKKGDMFYCVTYTALPESFDKHIEDVNKMIESFEIRK